VVKGGVMLLAAWKTMYPNTFRKKKDVSQHIFISVNFSSDEFLVHTHNFRKSKLKPSSFLLGSE
jgi:uncharacterized membrane protein (UPF0182 family)